MASQLHPVDLARWRRFLVLCGCNYARTKGDHEIWKKLTLYRPIVFPIKDKEISVYYIRNNLITLKISKEEFLRLLDHC